MHIYIEEGEKTKLAKEFIPINNLCAIIYDQLTEIYSRDNYQSFSGTLVNFDPVNQTKIKDLADGKIGLYEWLKENELNDELRDFLSKQITLAVVSDLVNFTFESLHNAKRGKMTVAYALLRKPFMDELLILEQLLIDPTEFIQRFYHQGDPSLYDPSDRTLDKKNIIKQAIDKLKPKFTFGEELIYDLRYNKASPKGLNSYANLALHIVTKDPNYRTANQDLNFVFSITGDLKTYWQHYYYFVPYLLIYAVTIIDTIVFNRLDDKANQDIKAVKSLRRLIATIRWTEITKQPLAKSAPSLYKAMSLALKYHCKKCSKDITLQKKDFTKFFEEETFYCPKCNRDLLTTHKSVQPIRKFLDSLP